MQNVFDTRSSPEPSNFYQGASMKKVLFFTPFFGDTEWKYLGLQPGRLAKVKMWGNRELLPVPNPHFEIFTRPNTSAVSQYLLQITTISSMYTQRSLRVGQHPNPKQRGERGGGGCINGLQMMPATLYLRFAQAGCEFTNCLGTSNQSLFPVETYHAILFHGRDMDNDLKVSSHFFYPI